MGENVVTSNGFEGTPYSEEAVKELNQEFTNKAGAKAETVVAVVDNTAFKKVLTKEEMALHIT